MRVADKLTPLPQDHSDKNLLAEFERLAEDLWMYSEDRCPYDAFIWDVEADGELSESSYLFEFVAVARRVDGYKGPIRKTSLLQEKHRKFFEFEGDKLANKKPSKFYREQYAAWNRFVGRIYTDNGALSETEIQKMRDLASRIWLLEDNSVRVFEYGDATTEHYCMGKTESGNWIGLHTVSVET